MPRVTVSDMVEQGHELSKKPHVVIATPGRLADHLDSGTDFSLKKIRFLVSGWILAMFLALLDCVSRAIAVARASVVRPSVRRP